MVTDGTRCRPRPQKTLVTYWKHGRRSPRYLCTRPDPCSTTTEIVTAAQRLALMMPRIYRRIVRANRHHRSSRPATPIVASSSLSYQLAPNSNLLNPQRQQMNRLPHRVQAKPGANSITACEQLLSNGLCSQPPSPYRSPTAAVLTNFGHRRPCSPGAASQRLRVICRLSYSRGHRKREDYARGASLVQLLNPIRTTYFWRTNDPSPSEASTA